VSAPRATDCAWPRCWSTWAMSSSRGQLLARFADDSVQADVAQARAGVAETAAQATEATANANRVRTLLNTGTFSGQQISQYLAAEQTALARVESAKAALAAQTAAPEEHPGAGAGRGHHLRAQRQRRRGRSQRHRTVSNDSPGAPRVARRGDATELGRIAARHAGRCRDGRQRRTARRPRAHGRADRGSPDPLRTGLCGPATDARATCAGQRSGRSDKRRSAAAPSKARPPRG
jgi:hypothetical protein